MKNNEIKDEIKNKINNEELENLENVDVDTLDDRKKIMVKHPKSRHGSTDIYIAALKQEIRLKRYALKKYATQVRNLERKCTKLCGILGQHGIDVDIEHL